METAAELVMEKAKTAKEEPAVTSKPLSAAFIEHCFNAGLLLITAYNIVTVYVLLKNFDSKWVSLGIIAYLTPYFGVLLYLILAWKGEHTEKYAMAHLDAQVAVPVPSKKAQAAENV